MTRMAVNQPNAGVGACERSRPFERARSQHVVSVEADEELAGREL